MWQRDIKVNHVYFHRKPHAQLPRMVTSIFNGRVLYLQCERDGSIVLPYMYMYDPSSRLKYRSCLRKTFARWGSTTPGFIQRNDIELLDKCRRIVNALGRKLPPRRKLGEADWREYPLFSIPSKEPRGHDICVYSDEQIAIKVSKVDGRATIKNKRLLCVVLTTDKRGAIRFVHGNLFDLRQHIEEICARL